MHPDQTGFLKGRSISENFVYAAELVQTCHKRKIPAVALKLDFRKAFDSIEWEALDCILEAKNFPAKWRSWIQHIFDTSQTAVLLNGCPGKWIKCKKGLRQGDPLSPYLFILMADVLQQMLTGAMANGVFEHPIIASAPCPVLQYADDTLIILKADANQLIALKQTLQTFSEATGLFINFDKSTFLPIGLEQEQAQSLATIFNCPVSSFPQPYLGLPLSTTKLRVSDFQPLIASSDKYLAGWKGHLLNEMGRSALVSSVLSSQPVYTMGSLLLFKGTVESLIQKQRAFMSTGEARCHGGQCKVAWEDCCLPKTKGGLGIPDIAKKNVSLLKKFISFIVPPRLLGSIG